MESKENAEIQHATSLQYSPFKSIRCGMSSTPTPVVRSPAASTDPGSSVKRSGASKKRGLSILAGLSAVTSGVLGGPAPYEDFLSTPEWAKRRRVRPAKAGQSARDSTSADREALRKFAKLVREEASMAASIDWREEVKAEFAGAKATIKQAASAMAHVADQETHQFIAATNGFLGDVARRLKQGAGTLKSNLVHSTGPMNFGWKVAADEYAQPASEDGDSSLSEALSAESVMSVANIGNVGSSVLNVFEAVHDSVLNVGLNSGIESITASAYAAAEAASAAAVAAASEASAAAESAAIAAEAGVESVSAKAETAAKAAAAAAEAAAAQASKAAAAAASAASAATLEAAKTAADAAALASAATANAAIAASAALDAVDQAVASLEDTLESVATNGLERAKGGLPYAAETVDVIRHEIDSHVNNMSRVIEDALGETEAAVAEAVGAAATELGVKEVLDQSMQAMDDGILAVSHGMEEAQAAVNSAVGQSMQVVGKTINGTWSETGSHPEVTLESLAAFADRIDDAVDDFSLSKTVGNLIGNQ